MNDTNFYALDRHVRARHRSRQDGLSIVELMVSVTISLLMLAALVALFVNSSRSNREMARANGMIESGRMAIGLLQNEVMQAGFWDSKIPDYDNQTADTAAIPADVPTAIPDPCAAYPAGWDTTFVRGILGIPVQVYDSAAVCGGVILNKKAGTDVLVVRHAETCVAGDSPNCPAAAAGKLYFQATQCLAEVGSPYVLDTVAANFTLHKRDCVTAAVKRQFTSSIYFIRDYAVTPGDGIPTLMRSQFDLAGGTLAHQPAVPMIEGIEGFRVELGVDDVGETGVAVNYLQPIIWANATLRNSATNRGDGVPDGDFVSCTTAVPCTVADLTNVTAVRIWVLARSRERSQGYTDAKTYNLGGTVMGPFNDDIKRHVFVTTVRLPNIAGRRITP
jgi:type IV pilus assembly protein PilW